VAVPLKKEQVEGRNRKKSRRKSAMEEKKLDRKREVGGSKVRRAGGMNTHPEAIMLTRKQIRPGRYAADNGPEEREKQRKGSSSGRPPFELKDVYLRTDVQTAAGRAAKRRACASYFCFKETWRSGGGGSQSPTVW